MQFLTDVRTFLGMNLLAGMLVPFLSGCKRGGLRLPATGYCGRHGILRAFAAVRHSPLGLRREARMNPPQTRNSSNL